MQIWDTMGQEKHRALTQAFYKNALGVLMVFDVTSRTSFDKLDFFYNEIVNSSPKHVKILLIGNKIDLIKERQVSTQEAADWARNKNIDFNEVSAKEDQGDKINQIFVKLLEIILKQLEQGDHQRLHKMSIKMKEI